MIASIHSRRASDIPRMCSSKLDQSAKTPRRTATLILLFKNCAMYRVFGLDAYPSFHYISTNVSASSPMTMEPASKAESG